MRFFSTFAALAAIGLGGCSPSAPPANEAGEKGAVTDEAPLPPPPPAASDNNGSAAVDRASQFTPIDDKNCRKIKEDAETGDWAGECPGLAGYRVEWSISDLRDNLTLIRGDQRTSLNIPSLVANGAFDSLGKQLEWRGPKGAAPDVLVVRVHVANAEGKSDSGSLAVARLGPAACLVAIVRPGAGQSDRARAIADGDLPACLKD